MQVKVDDIKEENNDVEETVKTEPIPLPAPSNPTIAETNGIDNEDSINLTIGEDEANLLAEEVFSLFYSIQHTNIYEFIDFLTQKFHRHSYQYLNRLCFQTETHDRRKGELFNVIAVR